MIVKHAHPRKWTTIDRRTINDNALSYRARGILAWLVDKPDDWAWSSSTLARAGREGRDAIRAALRELQDGGYLVRRKVNLEDGRWVTESWIYERPEDAQPKTDSQAPVTGFQASDFRASESQALSSEGTDTEDGERTLAVLSKLARKCKRVDRGEWDALVAKPVSQGIALEEVLDTLERAASLGAVWPSEFKDALAKLKAPSTFDKLAAWDRRPPPPDPDCPKCKGKGWYDVETPHPDGPEKQRDIAEWTKCDCAVVAAVA